ncbi:auxin efflux carrier component 5 [Nymphaea colorata]|nr:auxin efflux carrier component 5 [Nymphaea colorata]
MIGIKDIYNVISSTFPLYVPLFLGYGSVRWWKIFTPEQCIAINKLVAYFTLPFFTFEFASHVDPFAMNYQVIAADVLSKVIIVVILAFWAKCSSKGSYSWSITSFSLITLTNSLVVGVPMLHGMYGMMAEDLVVQLSVFQAIVWLTVLLFVLEVRKARSSVLSVMASSKDSQVVSVDVEKEAQGTESLSSEKPSICAILRVVFLKLAINPNSYASIVGVIWASLSNRWHFGMPSVMEGSITILSKAGGGMAMFSMGVFMSQQKKLIACGPSLAVFAMVLRFIAGPAAMAIASIVVGLRGTVLRIAIIQAAVPQSITSFIYAREYDLHAEVLSTAVIFGMLVSLPVLIAYYVILGLLN